MIIGNPNGDALSSELSLNLRYIPKIVDPYNIYDAH